MLHVDMAEGADMAEASTSSFGEQLRRMRETAGLTQEELAERAGLSRDAIGALENGRRRHPHPGTVRMLAAALGLSDSEAEALRTAAKRAVAPVPRASGFTPTPLPRPATRLVGRDRELAQLRDLLIGGEARLVTLTGPGGVGKTRLALAAAEELAARFGDGATFVSLAPIRDAALVVPTIAAALGLRESGGRPIEERLPEFLGAAELLLVLDNFEQVVAAAPDVARLLAAAPGVTALVTSRVVLRLSGEQEFPVAPFAAPDPELGSNLPALLANEAVTLFVLRSRSVKPDFALTEANAAAVAAVCARLDGLPLAIELAAARSKVLQPEGLLARLDRRLHVLTGGARDQPVRQQTIRDTVGWSYDLLTLEEQSLFNRLAVFAGGFTLEGGAAVMGGASPAFVLDLISSLVDKSLLVSLPAVAGEPRFGMLETVREFGLERLEAAAELGSARDDHATYFLELAEKAWPAFRERAGQEPWLERLEAERANLREALAWLDERGEVGALVRLAGALFWFWYIRGPLVEGRSWLERSLLSVGRDVADAYRVRAMVGAALLAHFQGDEEAARQRVDASLEQSPSLDDLGLLPFAQVLRGGMAVDYGEYDRAMALIPEAVARFRATNDRSNIALALVHLGAATWGAGDAESAVALWEESLAIQRELKDDWGASVSLGYLGLLAGERGEYARSAAALRESMQFRWDAAAWEDVAGSLADLASLAAAMGRAEQAARLFGAAAAIREEAERSATMLPERAVFERAEAAARTTLGADAYAAAVAAGRALRREQAVAEALAFADEIARSCSIRELPARPS
jgi:predicted ATPase/DNA-binding XRE family transcriptional regulator